MSWAVDGVSVGKGNVVGEDEILTMPDSDPFEFNTIGIHAGNAGNVSWEIVATEKGCSVNLVTEVIVYFQ